VKSLVKVDTDSFYERNTVLVNLLVAILIVLVLIAISFLLASSSNPSVLINGSV
jgi:hypothetical protein